MPVTKSFLLYNSDANLVNQEPLDACTFDHSFPIYISEGMPPQSILGDKKKKKMKKKDSLNNKVEMHLK